MKARFAIAALASLILLPTVGMAQGGTTPPAPADQVPAKVGILNFRQAIFATAEGKQALAELQSQLTPKQTEIDNMNKQIEDLRTRLRTGERTLSDDEKNRLIRQGEQLTRLLQRRQEDLQEDANTGQQEIGERIGAKMLEVVERYARENGFTVILDFSAQTAQVLWAAPQVNISQDIVRLYDQANPVKGAPAPAPTQPRPQPGQARPPQQQPPPAKPPQQ